MLHPKFSPVWYHSFFFQFPPPHPPTQKKAKLSDLLLYYFCIFLYWVCIERKRKCLLDCDALYYEAENCGGLVLLVCTVFLAIEIIS